jgi:hypothetical protein
MKASQIQLYQKNDKNNTITGLVDKFGYLYCPECCIKNNREGSPVWIMNSHLIKSNKENCEGCNKPIYVAW